MLIADEVMSGFGRTDEWFAVNHWNAVPDMITMAEGITSGYLLGEELALVKTFSFFPGNPTRFGCPTTSSVVLLFDASMGLPICLMEGDWVTVLKTGTSTAVTAACLAPPDTAIVTIFGAGTLGRMHLRALTRRFDLRHAHTVDIVPQAAEAYVAKLQPEMDFAIEPIPPHERERAIRESPTEIIVYVALGIWEEYAACQRSTGELDPCTWAIGCPSHRVRPVAASENQHVFHSRRTGRSAYPHADERRLFLTDHLQNTPFPRRIVSADPALRL